MTLFVIMGAVVPGLIILGVIGLSYKPPYLRTDTHTKFMQQLRDLENGTYWTKEDESD